MRSKFDASKNVPKGPFKGLEMSIVRILDLKRINFRLHVSTFLRVTGPVKIELRL